MHYICSTKDGNEVITYKTVGIWISTEKIKCILQSQEKPLKKKGRLKNYMLKQNSKKYSEQQTDENSTGIQNGYQGAFALHSSDM